MSSEPVGAGAVTIKGNATGGSGKIVLNCEANTHGIILQGPPHSAAASYTFILPTTMGTTGQVLTTNGTSVTSWTTLTASERWSSNSSSGCNVADSAMQVDTNNNIPAFGDDSLAAAGGVVIGGLYRIGNAVQVRVA